MYPYDTENAGIGAAVQAQCADVNTKLGYEPYRSNPVAEMEKRNAQIEQEHSKRSEGIAFLKENPQFDRFIELIRKGSIQI